MIDSFVCEDIIDAEELIVNETSEQDASSFYLNRRSFLNNWYNKTIASYASSSRIITRTELTDREYEFVLSTSVTSGVDVCYSLLSRFTTLDNEAQIDIVLQMLDYLAASRLPKEYAGGFIILMVKYHILPV